MRYIGFDLGTKTLGVSVSDNLGLIASTYKIIRFEENNFESLLPEVKKILEEFKTNTIILGLPKNMNNSLGFRSIETLEFKEKIEKYLNIEVVLQDERLSTIEANHYMLEADISRKKRKQKKDELAANIILQTYLDKEKGK